MTELLLKQPRDGWSTLHIGDWCGHLSYLSDPASDLLEAVNHVLVKRKPYAVHFDAEGYEYWLVFDLSDIHVISETDSGYALHSFEAPIRDVANALVDQIDAYFDEWAVFPCYLETEEERQRHRNQLDVLLGLVRYRAKTKGEVL